MGSPPLTDFWRIGQGTARRLETLGIYTMRGIAQANEDILYRNFGVDAELLIDHAWGREPTTMEDIKNYKPKNNSVCSGQVLGQDVDFEGGRLILKEMVDMQCLELVDKGLVTDSLTLHVSYNRRFEKKSAHGTVSMTATTSSTRLFMDAATRLYDRIVDRYTPIRRISITCNHVRDEAYMQYDLFTDPAELEKEKSCREKRLRGGAFCNKKLPETGKTVGFWELG